MEVAAEGIDGEGAEVALAGDVALEHGGDRRLGLARAVLDRSEQRWHGGEATSFEVGADLNRGMWARFNPPDDPEEEVAGKEIELRPWPRASGTGSAVRNGSNRGAVHARISPCRVGWRRPVAMAASSSAAHPGIPTPRRAGRRRRRRRRRRPRPGRRPVAKESPHPPTSPPEGGRSLPRGRISSARTKSSDAAGVIRAASISVAARTVRPSAWNHSWLRSSAGSAGASRPGSSPASSPEIPAAPGARRSGASRAAAARVARPSRANHRKECGPSVKR